MAKKKTPAGRDFAADEAAVRERLHKKWLLLPSKELARYDRWVAWRTRLGAGPPAKAPDSHPSLLREVNEQLHWWATSAPPLLRSSGGSGDILMTAATAKHGDDARELCRRAYALGVACEPPLKVELTAAEYVEYLKQLRQAVGAHKRAGESQFAVTPTVPLCVTRATSQYLNIIAQRPELASAAKVKAWEAVKEDLEPEERDELPEFDAWARYVRRGLNAARPDSNG